MTGRPTKLTPELSDAICEAIKQGLPDSAAALKAGIHRHTLAEWRERGRGGDPEFSDFFDSYVCAREERRAHYQTLVDKHAIKDGHVALRALQVLYPEYYGKHALADAQRREAVIQEIEAIRTDVDRDAYLKVVAALGRRWGLGGRAAEGASGSRDGSPAPVPPTTH